MRTTWLALRVLVVYVLLDWVLAPGRRPIPYRRTGLLLIFPVGWLLYTLVRGPFAVVVGFGLGTIRLSRGRRTRQESR